MNRIPEAEGCLREALAIYRQLFGDNDRRTIQTRDDLSTLLTQEGENAEADLLLEGAAADPK